MKRYIRCATTPYEYNQKQTEIGSPLKTLKGSRIARSKYGVGKEIGGSIYVHKQYADEIVPKEILLNAENVLNKYYPDFNYNCIKYDMKSKTVSFQEVPDFDTAREPKVGDYIIVKSDGSTKEGHSEYIFHHKWLFVHDNYKGFDVSGSWNWSKTWLSVLEEPSDGNGISRWNTQLDKYNLPKEESNMKISTNAAIKAAADLDSGTTFYETTENDFKEYYSHDRNIIISFVAKNYGFDALDLSRMYGSRIIGDTLYVCVTDGEYIEIDGEEVDPEYALDEYSIDELMNYIEPANDEIMNRYVSQYEFNIDIDVVALELLSAGHSFVQIVEDAKDIDLLDDVL